MASGHNKASVRKYEFVSKYVQSTSSEFHCPVCSEILKNPVLTKCCGIRFCRACLKRETKRCVICKKKPINEVADKQFQRIIEELQVYCLQRKYGCPWVGVLCELKEHLANGVDGCQYASGSCEMSCSAAITCDKLFSDQQLTFEAQDLENIKETSSKHPPDEDQPTHSYNASFAIFHQFVKMPLHSIAPHALTFQFTALTPVGRKWSVASWIYISVNVQMYLYCAHLMKSDVKRKKNEVSCTNTLRPTSCTTSWCCARRLKKLRKKTKC